MEKLTFDHFIAGYVSDADLFNQSSTYGDLLRDSSDSFQDKHILLDNYSRKQLLMFSKRLLRGSKSYSEDIFFSNRFLHKLRCALGPLARARYKEMVTYGDFSTGLNRTCTTNSIILSKSEGIVLHLTKLSNSMFDFNLEIEVNPLLSWNLGRNYYGQINHYSPYRLY